MTAGGSWDRVLKGHTSVWQELARFGKAELGLDRYQRVTCFQVGNHRVGYLLDVATAELSLTANETIVWTEPAPQGSVGGARALVDSRQEQLFANAILITTEIAVLLRDPLLELGPRQARHSGEQLLVEMLVQHRRIRAVRANCLVVRAWTDASDESADHQ